MFKPNFVHKFRQDLYEKALTKFLKALETDEGKKFIAHLVKAFVHSGTIHEVPEAETEFIRCDVTHAKLCTLKSMQQFQNVVKLRLEQFVRLEDEGDEQYERRQAAYFDALRTSNPYAVDNCVAYTADKTDKILCTESIQALTNLYNQIKLEKDTHPELWSIVRPKVVKKRPNKNFKKDGDTTKKKYSKQKHNSGASLGDYLNDSAMEAINKLRNEGGK